MTRSAVLERDAVTCVEGEGWEEGPVVTRRVPLVVLAEDDRDMRELVAETLVDAGYDVVQAGDGIELLEALGEAEDRPDLVITDVRMPGLSGLDALDEVREVDPLVPVVVITGFGHASTRERARALGVAAVLDKPFELEELLGWCARLAPPAAE